MAEKIPKERFWAWLRPTSITAYEHIAIKLEPSSWSDVKFKEAKIICGHWCNPSTNPKPAFENRIRSSLEKLVPENLAEHQICFYLGDLNVDLISGTDLEPQKFLHQQFNDWVFPIGDALQATHNRNGGAAMQQGAATSTSVAHYDMIFCKGYEAERYVSGHTFDHFKLPHHMPCVKLNLL